MAFISYTERPISALSSAWEARAGLIWVDFNFVMSQQAPVRWSLNSWAAQANHGRPIAQITPLLLLLNGINKNLEIPRSPHISGNFRKFPVIPINIESPAVVD